MFLIIAGGGKVGRFLAQTLAEKKFNIVIIEKDETHAQNLASELDNILVVAGDGCDPKVLENAKIEKAEIVVAVTGEDEDNLIISQLAKETFKVPRAIARVNNPGNQIIFDKLGIDAISATTVISKMIEEESSAGNLTTLLATRHGNLHILEFKLSPDSPATGKKIMDLKLPLDCLLATIIREDQTIFPRGATVLFPGDTVIVLTTLENEKHIKKLFLI